MESQVIREASACLVGLGSQRCKQASCCGQLAVRSQIRAPDRCALVFRVAAHRTKIIGCRGGPQALSLLLYRSKKQAEELRTSGHSVWAPGKLEKCIYGGIHGDLVAWSSCPNWVFLRWGLCVSTPSTVSPAKPMGGRRILGVSSGRVVGMMDGRKWSRYIEPFVCPSQRTNGFFSSKGKRSPLHWQLHVSWARTRLAAAVHRVCWPFHNLV
jgi:hypothetical protein